MIGKKKKPNLRAEEGLLVLPENQVVPASQKQSILETLISSKIEIDHSCGGMGTCGTCRVFVEKGLEFFDDRGELEAEIAQERGLSSTERLACQNKARPGIVIRKP